ncbi:hypothetical protein BV898_09410 [Hypsibius exemplaris]|uniref:Uncharacterized protein n=1 Tax=Hypsibius exemplaris TaxID=2072580 RepID=A0A1W0WMK1_HYPEX|nr:hypothetical protein BV898_09410 [Hypsibius exemplaris]
MSQFMVGHSVQSSASRDGQLRIRSLEFFNSINSTQSFWPELELKQLELRVELELICVESGIGVELEWSWSGVGGSWSGVGIVELWKDLEWNWSLFLPQLLISGVETTPPPAVVTLINRATRPRRSSSSLSAVDHLARRLIAQDADPRSYSCGTIS